jgi:hypothetical protein
MKKESKKQRKMRRTRNKRGAQHSTLAKQAMKKSVEKKKREFQETFNKKLRKMDKMTPEQLMREKRPRRLSPRQVETKENIPYPIGGKRRSRKRKIKSRRKRKRRRTKKK